MSFTKTIRRTLVSKSYLIFKAQEDCRYVVSVSICNTKFLLSLFDRAGCCHSEQLDVNGNAEKFLYVLAGLSFSSKIWLGYDPTIIDSVNGAKEVTLANTYVIQKTIFRSDVLRGRATICWHATCNGEDYAIKDSWSDTSRQLTEREILDDLNDIDGVPKVVEEAIVQVEGGDDSMDHRRSMMANPAIKWHKKGRKMFSVLENRLHRRLVLHPLGIPVVSFSSKRELISVLIDIVQSKKINIL